MSPSPSAVTASAGSRSIPGPFRRRPCARPPWSSSPRVRWTCSIPAERGVRAPGDPAAARPRRGRGGGRDGDHARAAAAQPRRVVARRRRASTDDHTVHIEGSDEPIRAQRIVIAVGDAAGAAGLGRVRRPHDHRLRRPAEAREPCPAHDDRGGRGRDRRRVRVDVRGARLQGHGRRSARPRPELPRQRNRRGLPVPLAPSQRHLPPAREGRCRRGAPRPRRAAEARLGQGDRLRGRALRDGPPRRHGASRARQGWPGGRQARADQGRRRLPDRGAAHLRRRRLRRRRPRRDRHGAGSDRVAARLRPARDAAAAADPDRRLRDPGAGPGRLHRGGADRRRRALRGRASRAGANWRGA